MFTRDVGFEESLYQYGEKLASVGILRKRILMLPFVWGAYGLAEVFGLTYVFGSLLNSIAYPANDKPIGGSYLPALAFNVMALFVVVGLSLYAAGIWNADFSNPKLKRDFIALGILFGSLLLVFSFPIFVFSAAVSLVYLLATNID